MLCTADKLKQLIHKTLFECLTLNDTLGRLLGLRFTVLDLNLTSSLFHFVLRASIKENFLIMT